MPGMYCIHCRYDLRATSSGACPECGRVFDATNPETYFDPSRPRSRGWIPMWVVVWIAVCFVAGFLISAGTGVERDNPIELVIRTLAGTFLYGGVLALMGILFVTAIALPIELFSSVYAWLRVSLRRRKEDK